MLYRRLNLYDKSIRNFKKAIGLFGKQGEMFRVINTTHYLSYVYFKKGSYKTGLDLIKKAIKKATEHKYSRMLAMCYCVEGMFYYAMDDIRQAKISFSQSIKLNTTKTHINWVINYNKTIIKIIVSKWGNEDKINYLNKQIQKNKKNILFEKLTDLKKFICKQNGKN